MALLVAVFSVALNCYLLYRIWALAPLLGSDALITHFVKPLFSQNANKVSLCTLQNDTLFFSELDTIIVKYSDIEPEYTGKYFGEVDKFKKFDIEFIGSDRKLQIFKSVVSKLLKQRVWSLFAFETPIFSNAAKQKEGEFIVTFLFALEQDGLTTLNDYIQRERSLKTKDTTLIDRKLEKEFEENGL